MSGPPKAYYLDASACVKRYSAETGTATVNKLFDSGAPLGSSELGLVEVLATFAGKRIAGLITDPKFGITHSRIEADWMRFHQLPLVESVAALGIDITVKYGLRGADSLHLASAIRMAYLLMDRGFTTTLVSSDGELNTAAKSCGFDVIDPGILEPSAI